MCGHATVSALRGQRPQMPLGLRLQAVVSHLMWVQGTEPRSSARALNY